MRDYTQLTEMQRYQISALKKEGLSQQEIARNIEVHPSTISRELRRNKGLRGYRPKQAQYKAVQRHKEKPKSIRLGSEQIDYIRQKIQEEWSPEQISSTMVEARVDRVSHETIYRYLQIERSEGGMLYTHLRHKNKKYRKRYGSIDRRGQIRNRVSIDERPAIVDQRSRIGDFEIDTVIGKNHKQALVTIVDRYSKLTLIKKVTHKRADLVSSATIELLTPLSHWIHTITADNGKEFASHETIADAIKADVYFAHPYSSWERGTNENTNGLIRQYFPKGSRFEEITDEQIQVVQEKLNRRPRKTLGFKTPYEVFFGKIIEGLVA
ncbi:MAG TPA: IS30 family transposase [Sulfuricurvum sp.]|jgi:IS30 family transposase|nr:MAG: IS30 family transposase [Campylobacterales bacterium 16-40-21]HQS67709.1 IS30 family transposase [Sulfuricurvum sp.]HQT37134.1 IS30 family transposase [Sulfuricurvum sp.]